MRKKLIVSTLVMAAVLGTAATVSACSKDVSYENVDCKIKNVSYVQDQEHGHKSKHNKCEQPCQYNENVSVDSEDCVAPTPTPEPTPTPAPEPTPEPTPQPEQPPVVTTDTTVTTPTVTPVVDEQPVQPMVCMKSCQVIILVLTLKG